MQTKVLSIFIPTYNRKERLLNQLHAIIRQGDYSDLDITIIDNHSNYDVRKAIETEFPQHSENIRVIKNPYNVGLALNIALPFYYCKTKWLWIISDDDEVSEGSINIIRNDIQRNDDYIVYKYSLDNEWCRPHKDVSVRSLGELVSYYKTNESSTGEFIFISNAVFNMEKLAPVLGDVIAFSYNAVAGINPIIFGLDSQIGNCFFSSKKIVKYKLAQPGSAWGFRSITTQIANLPDYPFKSPWKDVEGLLIMFNYWGFSKLMEVCESINDRAKARIYFRKIEESFTHGKSFFDCCMRKIVFIIYYYFGINIVKK